MAKRALDSPPVSPQLSKKRHLEPPLSIRNVASFEVAAAADANPPLGELLRTLENDLTDSSETESAVAYWMRMEDMRSESTLFSTPVFSKVSLVCDNRALAQASARALKDHNPLLVFFVLSPQDYAAHDRSPRRIDFTLRNLSVLKACLFSARAEHTRSFNSLGFSREAQYSAPCIPSFTAPNVALTCYLASAIREC